jgi:cell division protein FtsB
MASALTKAQLEAENAALRAEIATLKEQALNAASVASSVNRMHKQASGAPQYVKPQWQIDRAAAMEAARALAMTKHVIAKVG